MTGVFIVVTHYRRRRCYRDGVFLLSALVLLAGLYMSSSDETLVFRAFKSSRPLIIGRKEKKGLRSKYNENNGLLTIILRFAESVPFFCYRLRGFLGDNAAWDCQPDYSYIVMFTCLLAYPMSCYLASCRIGVAAVSAYFRRAFCRGNGFSFFSGCWKAVRSYTDDNGLLAY